MTLNIYNPKFRNVLFTEVREEKTAGGIYIPSSDFTLTEASDFFGTSKLIFDGSKSKLGKYVVVKCGPDVLDQKPGDVIVLMQGIQPEVIEFEDEGTHFQVMEQQIIGYERKE